jgi:hypothetical protein
MGLPILVCIIMDILSWWVMGHLVHFVNDTGLLCDLNESLLEMVDWPFPLLLIIYEQLISLRPVFFVLL